MNSHATAVRFVLALFPVTTCVWLVAAEPPDPGPQPDERQLPYAMRSAMTDLPRITVGREKADLVGADNRVLQAAVDYIAGLGGGTVEIGPGEYLMRDSLHLRSHVTVRGQASKTHLRKAAAAVSALALDGDFDPRHARAWQPDSDGGHPDRIAGGRSDRPGQCHPSGRGCRGSPCAWLREIAGRAFT